MCVCICMCVCVCVCLCVCVCVYRMCACVWIFVCVCMFSYRIRIRSWIRSRIRIRIRKNHSGSTTLLVHSATVWRQCRTKLHFKIVARSGPSAEWRGIFMCGTDAPVLRVRDVYPGSWFLSIPDPGSNNSTKRGGGKNFCPTIYCSHKYHKIVNNIIFEQVKKIFCQNTKNYSTYVI